MLSTAEATGLIQGCPLFSIVPQETLQTHSAEERFAAGEFLIRQNEVGNSLMIIAEGTVEVFVLDESGEPYVIDQSGPSDIIGEIALLTSEPRTADVRAVDAVTVLRLSEKSFHQLRNEYSELSVILTHLVAMRLENGGRDHRSVCL